MKRYPITKKQIHKHVVELHHRITGCCYSKRENLLIAIKFFFMLLVGRKNSY